MTLTRRTPLRSKRPTPRTIKTPPELQCALKRCTKLATVLGRWCGQHAVKEADRLFSLYIRARDGKCMVCGQGEAPSDGLQCSHLVSRRYFAVRWDPANAVSAHASCHMRTTHNPLMWDRWCTEHLGPAAWGALKFRAERGGKPDVGWIIEGLRRKLEEVAA